MNKFKYIYINCFKNGGKKEIFFSFHIIIINTMTQTHTERKENSKRRNSNHTRTIKRDLKIKMRDLHNVICHLIKQSKIFNGIILEI